MSFSRNYHITETLYENSVTVVYRALRIKDNQSVIVKMLKPATNDENHITQFVNEIQMLSMLRSDKVAKILDSITSVSEYIHIFEDIGGRSLFDHLIERDFSLKEALFIALELAETVAYLHRKNIIHADINPKNIIYNPETKQVRLIDFGYSVVNNHFRYNNDLRVGTSGNILYMSPEQTGRTKQKFDYRSDLYSMGMTLYHLFSGELPFSGKDRYDLIHKQIALQLPSLDSANPSIPHVISAIVHKLIEKKPEQRYQSDEAVTYDLKKCFDQLISVGEIVNFEIATIDRPSFIVGEQLYGREAELSLLKQAALKAATPTAMRIVISGPSGIGKTRLAEEFFTEFNASKTTIIRAKFDQYHTALPYSIFKDIFTQLRTLWLSQSVNTPLVLDENSIKVLMDLFPELKDVLPRIKPSLHRATYDLHHQLTYAVKELLNQMVGLSMPIVLFIDDLQWADQSSLDLLEQAIITLNNSYFHLVISYREAEMQRNSLAFSLVKKIEHDPFVFPVILHLSVLEQAKIHLMLSELLMRDGNDVRELASIVEKKTNGNPFYLKTLLEYLVEADILQYTRGKWKFSLDKVNASSVSVNIADIIKQKYDRLNADEKRYLQYLTLLGEHGGIKRTFDAMTAFGLMNKPMKRLEEEGFIEIYDGQYKFAHDQIQQFAYLTLSTLLKRKIHLQIGRYLEQNRAKNPGEIITLVNHLNKGYDPLKFPKKLYALNLEALEEMVSRNAYVLALKEIRWMEGHRFDAYLWEHDRDRGFRFTVIKIKTIYINGWLDEAIALIHWLMAQSKTVDEQLICFTLYKDVCVTQGKGYIPLLQYGKQLFSKFGLEVPSSDKQIAQEVDRLNTAIRTHIQYQNIQAIVNLPTLSKPQYGKLMSLLVDAWEVAFYLTDIRLMQWMYLNVIDLSLRYGNTSASAFGYVLYGAQLVTEGQYKKAYEFGQLALEINHRFNDAIMLPKVHNFMANFISPYVKLYENNRSLYAKSLHQSQINGDIVFGTWANFLMHLSSYFSGYSLHTLHEDMAHNSTFLLDSGDAKMIGIFNFLSHTVKVLQEDRTAQFNEEALTLTWEREKFYPGLAWYAIIKGQTCFLEGSFEAGLRILERHLHSELNEVIMFSKIRLHFIRSLLLLGIDMPLSEAQKSVLESDIASFDQMAKASPKIFKVPKLLLYAERLKTEKSIWKVSEAYDIALTQAKQEKNHFYTLITALCAHRFWKKLNYPDMSQFYLNEAMAGCHQWGAYALADKLKQHKSIPKQSSSEISSHNSSSAVTIDEELNYQTVIKSFQILSKTIDKNEVLTTLMQLIVEHATASRAVLIFRDHGVYNVNASLDFKRNAIDVSTVMVEDYSNIPHSMIRYVINTFETIISDAPSETGKFQHDEYIRTKKPASCVVLPITLEGSVSGLLYLENDEIATVMSVQSIKTLELLLTQSAIIFKNALLFEKSQASEKELNKAQQISKMGSWKFNCATQKIQWSAETYRIYDVEPFSIEIDNDWFFQHLRLEDRAYILESIEHALNAKKPYDVVHTIITAKGKKKIVHQRAEVYWDHDVQMMSGTIQDITDSKRAEELISQLSQVVNQSPFSIIITNASGKIQYMNPQCLNITGYFEQELIAKKMSIFRSGVHGESFYAGLWNTISKEKKLWKGTIVNRMKNGSFVDLASTIFPIFDQSREIINYVTIQEDITQQNIKDKLFIMQTRQAQMGEMLSMIAHQWRQPLAVISTLINKERINLVLNEPNTDELMQNFDDIETQVQHLSGTISDFRDFFKPDKETVKTTNELIVSKTLSLITHMLKQKNITIDIIHENDEAYMTYEHEMVQVILNLIKNAQDAFEEKGITDRSITITSNQHRGFSTITVEDNAGGVSPSISETLFLPYVSTKNEQNGTGLGLYMSKTIVEDHCQGTLTFSNTSRGVKFTIRIPLKAEYD